MNVIFFRKFKNRLLRDFSVLGNSLIMMIINLYNINRFINL